MANQGLETLPQEKLSLFQRIADYVSAAMGRPTNIMVWLVLVIAWTAVFAFGGPHLASGTWLPSWFTSQGFNFPMNLITTVAELFIGFLVAASANRSERNLEATLARLSDMAKTNGTLEAEQADMLQENTELTKQVHALVVQVAAQTSALAHVNAELNVIRQAVAPQAPNPAVGTDSAPGLGVTGGPGTADDPGNGRG
jgi:low affinity Fe/Cu permease